VSKEKMGYFEKKFHSFYGVRWGRGAERWRHLAISPCPGRIPAAFRSSAGSAIKPRPETEMVACI
jgi:hypothetical protein